MSSERCPPRPGRIFLNSARVVVYHPKARPRIEKLTVSHILIKHNESCYPFDALGQPVTRSKYEAIKLIKSLHFLISKGMCRFDDLVFSFSECRSRANKGILEIDHFQQGNALKFFNNAAAVLRPGKISKFTESPNGFHIFYRRSGLEPNPSRKRTRKKSNSAKYRLCQILVKHKESRMPIDTLDLPVTRSKEEAQRIIKSIHYLLNHRLFTFRTLVSTYSDCLSKFNNGIIDTKQFREGLKQNRFNRSLAPGEHSEVFESPNGFHILCYCRVRYDDDARRGGSLLRSRCISSCGYYTRKKDPTVTNLSGAPDKHTPNPTVTMQTRAPDNLISNPTVTIPSGAPDKSVANPAGTILTSALDERVANSIVTIPTGAPDKSVANATVTIPSGAPKKSVANPKGTILTGAPDERLANQIVTIPTGAPDKLVAHPIVTNPDWLFPELTVTILTGVNPSVANLKLSHIMISATKSAVVINYLQRNKGTHKQKAKGFITDLRYAINNGCLTFERAAAIYSDCLSGQDGGNIEKQFRPGLMGEAFDKAALALAPGEISEVVESSVGFHIIHRRCE